MPYNKKESDRQYNLKHKERIKQQRYLYRLMNKKKIAESNAIYYNANKEKCNDVSKLWRKNNRQKHIDGVRLWQLDNPKLVRGYKAKYQKKNSDKHRANTVARRIKKLQATPLWLNEKHKREIVAWYSLAHATNLTVDHVVPLQGENVCGLHVPWNLRLLTLSENSSKSNTFSAE